MAECTAVMIDCQMIDHIRHTERSEQESEEVRVFLVLAAKALEKAVRHNDIREPNERVAHYIISLDVNLPIFFCGIPPMQLTSPINPPRFESRFPRPYVLPHWDWPIEGQGPH